MNAQQAGPLILVLGLLIALAGLIAWWGGFSWFGRLPGDIRIERENLHIYFPLASMLLVSLVASAVLWLVRRFFG